MFETLKYWWVTKKYVAPVVAAMLIVVGGLGSIIGFWWSGRVQAGRVLSTASLPVLGHCAQGNEVLSVRLSNGHVVTAYALYGRFVASGERVFVRKQLSACNGAGYQVVGLR